MNGMSSCREIRQALGVYVLGAIEPAERAQVDEHLALCPDCREELASLAGLPAMLRKVPTTEAERLAALDGDPSANEMPSEEMLQSLAARTANVRRMHRWRAVAVAAAAVVVALAGGVAVTKALEPSSPAAKGHAMAVNWQKVTAVDPATGAHLTVMYAPMSWGTEMRVHVTGLNPGSVCEFQVTDTSGASWPLGGWVLNSRNGAAWYPVSTWFSDKDLRGFELTVGGKVVASAQAA
jgi:anti-sigma factor RsiW